MKRRFDYDIVILGGGSAGIVSGVMASSLKLKTLVIEKYKMGGECLNTGCVPSKALLHAAKTARLMRTAGDIGLSSLPIARDDAAGVMAWVRGVIGTVREADATDELLRRQGATVRIGDAHFVDSRTLLLDGERLTSEYFILATGSRPLVPEIPGLDNAPYCTNRDIFDLDEIPARLLVIGGGPVGVEMAQAFQLLGSQVTLVQKNQRLLPHDDAELAAELERRLRQDGVDIRLDTSVVSIGCDGQESVALLKLGRDTSAQPYDRLLVATGRAPNIDRLHLEAAGVVTKRDHVPTDRLLRTSAKNIYACGDILGERQFSHMAEFEAKAIVQNIAFPWKHAPSFRVAPWTTFTDPELAHVGLTEEEARARGVAYDVLRQPFAQNDRAIADNEALGLVKVLTSGIGGEIIGAHILGPRAGELIQEWVFAMQSRRSIRSIADMIHVYPCLTMASQHAAQRWYEQKAQLPPVQRALESYAHAIRPRLRSLAIGVALAGIAGAAAALGRKSQSR